MATDRLVAGVSDPGRRTKDRLGGVSDPGHWTTARRIGLVLAALLFAAWVGWLAYEAFTVGNPIVVSLPQIMRAPIVVDAEVRADGTAVVKQVRRPGTAMIKPGDTLRISRVTEARYWSGPGTYILPLEENRAGFHEVVLVVPRRVPPEPPYPAIYPLLPTTEAQVRQALENSVPPDRL